MNEATARPGEPASPWLHICCPTEEERHKINAHAPLVEALEKIQVGTQDPAIERLCAAALAEAKR